MMDASLFTWILFLYFVFLPSCIEAKQTDFLHSLIKSNRSSSTRLDNQKLCLSQGVYGLVRIYQTHLVTFLLAIKEVERYPSLRKALMLPSTFLRIHNKEKTDKIVGRADKSISQRAHVPYHIFHTGIAISPI